MDLEATLASLQISDAAGSPEAGPSPESPQPVDETGPQLRRSSRLKSRFAPSDKKRVLTKPIKVSEAPKDVHDYYLDKRTKRLSPNNLETIYEDTDEKVMSSRKFRRSINFTASMKGLKVKKRRMKVKGVAAQFRVKDNAKLTLMALFERLQNIDGVD